MKQFDNVTYLRDSDLAGIEVGRVRATRHVFPKHTHEGIYAIGLMECGGSWCLDPGNETAFVASGEVALINPGQVHSGVPCRGRRISYRMVYIELNRMADTAGDICEGDGTLPEFQRMVVRDPALFRRLIRLCDGMGGGAGRLQKQSLALEGLARLLSAHGALKTSSAPAGHHRRTVRQAKEILCEHLDRKLSLETVAEAVGLSRFHFLRVFKKAAGIPPHQFRTQRRIDAARRLIKNGMPLSQVALATGFNDQSHFTNNFKKLIGATPSQYRSEITPTRRP